MKILFVSDVEDKALWDFFTPERIQGAELIISCGDLNPDYLQFLVTMTNLPLLYVRGNHDRVYDKNPPLGCIPIDNKVYNYKGLRILGLGGSMRYKPGSDMYTEEEMARRILKMTPMIALSGGFDLLVTHAPAKGCGDLEDLPHTGFECFNSLLARWKPAYMCHGHVHKDYGGFVRDRMHESGTKVLNSWSSAFLDIPEGAYPARGRTGSPLYDLYISFADRKTGGMY